MKLKTLLLLSLFSLSFLSVEAQLRPTKKAPGKAIKRTQQGKPMMVPVCDSYMDNYKKLLKVVIMANPTQNNPLKISKLVPSANILYSYGTNGHIIMDRRSGSTPFPPINMIITNSGNGVYPVSVSSFSFLSTQNGQNSTVGLAWEAGNYNDVVQVTDIFKVGNQAYAAIKRSNGKINKIRIYPNHQMDGCEIPVR